MILERDELLQLQRKERNEKRELDKRLDEAGEDMRKKTFSRMSARNAEG